MLRTRYLTTLLLALMLPLTACGGDDDGPTEEQDPLAALVGSYTTQSFVYTADSDPTVTIDLQQFSLGIQSLTVAADGSFTGLLILPDEQGNAQQIPLEGTLSNVTQTSLSINFTGVAAGLLDDLDVSYTLSGSILTFTATDVSFDFTLQGNPEVPADLTVVLIKSS